jgi:hypothetical protein
MMNANSRDQAGRSGGMPLTDLERLLGDVENEPRWRDSADKCADYYDHKQASAERVMRSQDTGEPLVIVNLIQRTINGALGQEAKSRLNWKVSPDSDAFSEVATVLSEKLHEAQREAKTDMAISEAYSSMLRTGIGWVHVDRSPNPLAYPYRVQAVHRNEVWWDWRAKQADLSDATWMLRQRWADVDEVRVLVPEARNLLDMGVGSGPITDAMSRTITASQGNFEDIDTTRRSFSRSQEEWLDNSLRKRIRLYCVYYKQHKEVVALVSGTKRIRFNPKNPFHVAAAVRGAAKLMRGPGYVMRRAMFAGPWRLYDDELPGQHFPLVPFICYRCDDDASPYGLVHGMIQPQDEFNERRSRLLWLLKAKQIFVDEDALDERYNNLVDLAREAMRPDAMFVLKKNRQNGVNALRIETNMALSAEQSQVMENAKLLIQDQPGLYGPQFGGNRVGAESGIALNSLVEQSLASLGETGDNYRNSRQMVGDALVCEMVQDHQTPNMPVEVGSGKKRRVVTLNGTDKAGLPINSVEDAQVKVALGDVPATAAFKQQQQVFLGQALQSVGNNPIAQAVLIPALLESGDLEHRAEYAKWLRKQAGVPEPGDMADEEMQAQLEQQQAQQQAVLAEANQRAMAAEMAVKESSATLNQTKAVLTQVQALLTQRQADLAQAQTLKTAAEAEAIATQPTEDELISGVLKRAAGQQQEPARA